MKSNNAVQTHMVVLIAVAVMGLYAAMNASAGGTGEKATSAEYQERPALETSLFQSDKTVLDEEAIQKILASKFVMRKAIKVALFKIPEAQQQAMRYYGYGYWRSEEYLHIQQEFIETLSTEVAKCSKVEEVAALPGLLTPKEPTIALIRETAVRLQSDMIMVFRLSSDVYEKYRLFQSEQAKAYCTCEGFLLDVRTGIIPLSRIITKEYLATRETKDTNFRETMARAEKEAALLSLRGFGSDVVDFLNAFSQESVGDRPEK